MVSSIKSANAFSAFSVVFWGGVSCATGRPREVISGAEPFSVRLRICIRFARNLPAEIFLMRRSTSFLENETTSVSCRSSTPTLHKYQGTPSAYVRCFYHRELRGHREAIAEDILLLFSVLQGRKNLRFFPDNVTGASITLFICNGLWTRAKAQRRKEKTCWRSLRLGGLNE